MRDCRKGAVGTIIQKDGDIHLEIIKALGRTSFAIIIAYIILFAFDQSQYLLNLIK